MGDLSSDLANAARAAIVLIASDYAALRNKLCDGIRRSEFKGDPTANLILDAAHSLDLIIEGSDAMWRWAARPLSIASNESEWRRTTSVVSHLANYTAIARSVRTASWPGPSPLGQLTTDPISYKAFLVGVAESHLSHANTFAKHPLLADAHSLVDIGCGLGAFSAAWLAERPSRTATGIDLPDVENWIALDSRRFRYLGIDLTEAYDFPPADVYLLANVLHLIPEWRSLVRKVAESASVGSIVVVMEASPLDRAGAFFALQVHLRSGGRSGLIPPDELLAELERLFSVVEVSTDNDPADPLERAYRWYFAR